MMKLTKSWGVTLLFGILVAALPVVNEPLEKYGIHITEAELNHFLMAFGLSGGLGAAAQVRKSLKPKHVMPATEELNREMEKIRDAANRDIPADKSGPTLVGQPEPNVRDWLHRPEDVQSIPGSAIQMGKTPPKPTGIHHPETIMKHDIHEVQWGGEGWCQTNFHRDPEKGNALHYGQAFLWIKVAGAETFVLVSLFDDQGRRLQLDQSHDHDEDNDRTTTRLEMFGRGGAPMPRGKYVLNIRSDNQKGFLDDEFWIV